MTVILTADAHISASVQDERHEITVSDKTYLVPDITVNVKDGTDDQYSNDVTLAELINCYIVHEGRQEI